MNLYIYIAQKFSLDKDIFSFIQCYIKEYKMNLTFICVHLFFKFSFGIVNLYKAEFSICFLEGLIETEYA